MKAAFVPPAAELLVHAGFVRSVARAALHGEAGAEDVVQETWLAALESGPRHPRALRAWLGAVARRQAANRVRRESAARRREARAARPDGTPSVLDVALRAELGRRLVGAVLALEEPYRQAVLLRFYEDLPPREIAGLLGLPVETVRTRLKRGLARLRGRLEAVYGDRPGGPRTALLLLAGPAAGHVAAPTLGALGGVIMANKAFWAAAALLLVIGAGLGIESVLRGRADDAGALATGQRDETRFVAPAQPPVLGGGSGREGRVGDADAGAAEARVGADVPVGALRGRVVRKDSRAGVAGVPVYGVPHDVPRAALATRSDGAGWFTLAGLPPGETSVFALGAGWVDDRFGEVSGTGYDPTARTIGPVESAPIVLEVVPCAVVEGVVLDAQGTAVEGARVQARTEGVDLRPREAADPSVVLSGADGSFRHDALVPGRACDFVVRSARHPQVVTPRRELRPGADNPRLTVRLPSAHWLGLTVRDARTRTPVAAARILAVWVDAPAGQYLEEEWPTSAQGQARVGPLPEGRIDLHVQSPWHLPREVPVDVAGAADISVEVLLDLGATIRGRVLLPPDLDATGLTVDARPIEAGCRASPEFPVEADGSFLVSGLDPGRYRVHATLHTPPQWFVGAAEVEAPGDGVVLHLAAHTTPFPDDPGELEDRLAEVRLHVVTPSGEPVSRGWVRFHDEVAGGGVDLEEGLALIRVLGEGPGVSFEVSGLPEDEGGTPLAAGVYGPLRPQGGRIVLRLEHGLVIRGRVEAPGGTAVGGAGIAVFALAGDARTDDASADPVAERHSGPDGTFEIGGLRAGPYVLLVDVPRTFVSPGPLRAQAGGDEVILRLQRGATARLGVLDPEGRPLQGALVTVRPSDEVHRALLDEVATGTTDATGATGLERLALGGTYSLVVLAPAGLQDDLLPHLDPAWVAADGEVRLERGGLTTGRVFDRDGRPVAGAVVWYRLGASEEVDWTYADQAGRFRIGPTRLDVLRLHADPPGRDPEAGVVPHLLGSPGVAAGTRDVPLRLER